MGRIGELAPLGAILPGISNLLLSKSLAGVAKERSLPRFQKSFRSRFKPNGGGTPVVLFDDTFNNHFRPQTAGAAQRVLEAAGCAVRLPRSHVCCGRPYYDWGMLDRARRALQRVLEVLAPDLAAGAPIVVLEPGCLSVFRDEMKQLLPDDPRANRLAAQVVSLGEYLEDKRIPRLDSRVLFHGHCHQKALWGTGADLEVLRRAGCEVTSPDTGCCGMAGAFGYRPEFYETSKRIAGLALLPALGKTPEAAVVANGFSCREQIEDLGARPTRHLAELLAEGLGK
jgi:Fe-S oxidoreductase